MTSSPGPIPAAATAMWSAAVPDEQVITCAERAGRPEPLDQQGRLRPLPVEERVLPEHGVQPLALGLAPADEARQGAR